MAHAWSYNGWYGVSGGRPEYYYGNRQIGYSLAHYGIKGQRWGYRRFQNEDGTLTEEGMRRYGIIGEDGKLHVSKQLRADYAKQKTQDSPFLKDIRKEKKENKPISRRRQQLIEHYKSKGYTQEHAEVQAIKRERAEKLVKVAGAIALTAALAYGAYKGRQWLLRNGDQKIRVGSDIFRTTKDASEDLNRAGYVVDNARDADKYVGAYGNQIHQNKAGQRLQSIFLGKKIRPDVADNNIYQITGKAAKNIKVAGDRKAKKVYEQLLKNDKDFAADNEVVKRRWMDTGDSYSDFNKRLVDHEDEASSRVQKKFYDALKAKGYGGLIDSNDRDHSGYHVNKPVILFNMKDSIAEANVRTINPDEVRKKYPEAMDLMQKQAVRDVTLSEAFKSVRNIGGYATASAGAGLISLRTNEKVGQNRANRYRSIVKQYKKEHPGTQLSDSQILENELGYRLGKRS